MNRLLRVACGGVLLLMSACGISEKQQQEMQESLYVGLTDAFLAQDSFVAVSPEVSLSNVEHGDFFSVPGYRGQFSCSFYDGSDKVSLHGSAGFDKDGFLAEMPDGKLAVDLSIVLVNGHSVSPATSIYNLPSFFSGRGK